MNAWTDVVEYSYTVSPGSDPAVTGTGNPLFKNGQQGYLTAAPGGIDAPAAWAKNADGSGLVVIDIEQGWFLKHQDLPQTITLLEGLLAEEESDGTFVLHPYEVADSTLKALRIRRGTDVVVLRVPAGLLVSRLKQSRRCFPIMIRILLKGRWSSVCMTGSSMHPMHWHLAT